MCGRSRWVRVLVTILVSSQFGTLTQATDGNYIEFGTGGDKPQWLQFQVTFPDSAERLFQLTFKCFEAALVEVTVNFESLYWKLNPSEAMWVTAGHLLTFREGQNTVQLAVVGPLTSELRIKAIEVDGSPIQTTEMEISDGGSTAPLQGGDFSLVTAPRREDSTGNDVPALDMHPHAPISQAPAAQVKSGRQAVGQVHKRLQRAAPEEDKAEIGTRKELHSPISAAESTDRRVHLAVALVCVALVGMLLAVIGVRVFKSRRRWDRGQAGTVGTPLFTQHSNAIAQLEGEALAAGHSPPGGGSHRHAAAEMGLSPA